MSRPDSGSKSSEAAQPGLFVVRCIERAMLGGIDGRLMKDKTEVARSAGRRQDRRPRKDRAAIRSEYCFKNRSQWHRLLIILSIMVLGERVCIRPSNATT